MCNALIKPLRKWHCASQIVILPSITKVPWENISKFKIMTLQHNLKWQLLKMGLNWSSNRSNFSEEIF